MGKYIKLFETHTEYNTYINGQDAILPNVSYCEDNNDVHYNPWTDPRLIVTYNVTSTSEATTLYMYYEGMVTGDAMFDNVEIDGVEVSVSTLDTAQGTYQFSTTGEHIVKYTLSDPTFIGISITDRSDPTTWHIGATFNKCTNLTSITIPNSVTSISQGAFHGCASLIRVNSNINGKCIIPNSVTTIDISAFDGCTGLRKVIIPDSVTSIGDSAFRNCTGLTSVTIPNSVTSIGDSAFTSCTGLTSVTIPNSVTSIGDYAFQGCSSLTSIISLATTAPTIYSNTFQDVKTGGTLTVPSGSTGYDVWMGTGDYYLGKYSWTKVEQ